MNYLSPYDIEGQEEEEDDVRKKAGWGSARDQCAGARSEDLAVRPKHSQGGSFPERSEHSDHGRGGDKIYIH